MLAYTGNRFEIVWNPIRPPATQYAEFHLQLWEVVQLEAPNYSDEPKPTTQLRLSMNACRWHGDESNTHVTRRSAKPQAWLRDCIIQQNPTQLSEHCGLDMIGVVVCLIIPLYMPTDWARVGRTSCEVNSWANKWVKTGWNATSLRW